MADWTFGSNLCSFKNLRCVQHFTVVRRCTSPPKLRTKREPVKCEWNCLLNVADLYFGINKVAVYSIKKYSLFFLCMGPVVVQ